MRLGRYRLCFLFVFNILLGNNINIESHKHDSQYEEYTYKICQQESEKLEKLFELENSQIDILLFNSHNEFKKICGLSRHIQGVLISSQNKIFLKTPTLTSTNYKEYRKLVIHELIHLYHNRKLGLNLFPDWFNEGIAEYFSGSFQLKQKILLSKNIFTDNIPTLDKLINIEMKYNNRAAVKYIFSASIIEFLVVNYGDSVISEILTAMQGTKDFQSSLETITQLRYDVLTVYWKQYIKQKYSSLYFLDIQYIIWLFLPFVFIFSLIVKLIQNQLTIRIWKYERFEEQINNIFTDPIIPGD